MNKSETVQVASWGVEESNKHPIGHARSQLSMLEGCKEKFVTFKGSVTPTHFQKQVRRGTWLCPDTTSSKMHNNIFSISNPWWNIKILRICCAPSKVVSDWHKFLIILVPMFRLQGGQPAVGAERLSAPPRASSPVSGGTLGLWKSDLAQSSNLITIGLGLTATKQHLGCMKTAKSPENSMTSSRKIFSTQTFLWIGSWVLKIWNHNTVKTGERKQIIFLSTIISSFEKKDSYMQRCTNFDDVLSPSERGRKKSGLAGSSCRPHFRSSHQMSGARSSSSACWTGVRGPDKWLAADFYCNITASNK